MPEKTNAGISDMPLIFNEISKKKYRSPNRIPDEGGVWRMNFDKWVSYRNRR
jgi:hypothetical protein